MRRCRHLLERFPFFRQPVSHGPVRPCRPPRGDGRGAPCKAAFSRYVNGLMQGGRWGGGFGPGRRAVGGAGNGVGGAGHAAAVLTKMWRWSGRSRPPDRGPEGFPLRGAVSGRLGLAGVFAYRPNDARWPQRRDAPRPAQAMPPFPAGPAAGPAARGRRPAVRRAKGRPRRLPPGRRRRRPGLSALRIPRQGRPAGRFQRGPDPGHRRGHGHEGRDPAWLLVRHAPGAVRRRGGHPRRHELFRGTRRRGGGFRAAKRCGQPRRLRPQGHLGGVEPRRSGRKKRSSSTAGATCTTCWPARATKRTSSSPTPRPTACACWPPGSAISPWWPCCPATTSSRTTSSTTSRWWPGPWPPCATASR